MKKLHIIVLSGAFIFGGCKATEEEPQKTVSIEQSSEEIQKADKIKDLEWRVARAENENKELQDKNQILKWTSVCALSATVLEAIGLNLTNSNGASLSGMLSCLAFSGAFIYSTYDALKD